MDDRESSKYLKEIINTINDGIFLVGPDGRISMVNPALERLTGFSAEELTGKPCSVLNCDICRISRKEGRDHWCRLFDDKKEHRKRCVIIRKDGTTLPVLKNASLLMENGRVVVAVETLTDISELVEKDRQIEELSRRLTFEDSFHGLIGESPAMLQVYRIIEKAAESDAPVIIFGESGTGKELAARAIHELGPRHSGPYIQLNCAALNESLLESELFGHVKGAFTGALRHREGRFEAAHGGDIFLDEIGDVPLSIQVKLLRVLETKRIERVGDNRPVDVDVRIISATNRDLRSLVAEGRFREDFLFRINVLPIHLPALRERKEDIPLLAGHFLTALRERSGKDVDGFEPEAMALLTAYDWPGNVRELRSALEYAVVIADEGRIAARHLPPGVQGQTAAPAGGALQQIGSKESADERTELIRALIQAGGNKSEAARILGVHRGTVINRMRKYGVDMAREIRS